MEDKIQLQITYFNLSCQKGDDGGEYVLGDQFPADEVSILRGKRNSITLWWPNVTSSSTAGVAAGFVESPGQIFRSNSSYQNGSPEALFFGYTSQVMGVACSIRAVYVEIDVECPTIKDCRTARVRRSRLPHLSTNVTQMDGSDGVWDTWYLIANGFV